MGIVYAVINQKGGVGKTTTAFNMAAEIANSGKQVLVLDMDPQGSLTTSMGQISSDLDNTMGDLFATLIRREPLPDITSYILKRGKLDFIPANLTLSVADISIVTATAREYLLKKIIAPVRDVYDYIIIDCPPTLGMLMVNVLTAADSVIVPIKATDMDTKGFEPLLDTIEMIKLETNPKLQIAGVLLTMFDRRMKESKDVLRDITSRCEEWGIYIFKTKIGSSTKAARAFRERRTIAEYEKSSFLAENYREFALEVMGNE